MSKRHQLMLPNYFLGAPPKLRRPYLTGRDSISTSRAYLRTLELDREAEATLQAALIGTSSELDIVAFRNTPEVRSVLGEPEVRR